MVATDEPIEWELVEKFVLNPAVKVGQQALQVGIRSARVKELSSE